MKKSLIKIVSLLIIVGLNWTGLSAVLKTFAYFSDTETANTNIYQTGILDMNVRSGQGNFVSGADNMIPGKQVNRDIYVGETAFGLPLKHNVSFEFMDGNIDLCNQLDLKIWYNHYHGPKSGGYANRDMRLTYNGKLSALSDHSYIDFEIPHPDDQFDNNPSDGIEQWFYYSIILPSGIADDFQGEVCDFDFVFKGWQDNVANYGDGGFSDIEKIESTIKTSYWNPPVVLNEFLPNAGNYLEFIEIYNMTTSPINLDGFCVKTNGNIIPIDATTTSAYSGGSTIIPANGWLVVTTGGDKINDSSGTIALYNPNDIEVDSYSYQAPEYNINNTPGWTNNLVAYWPFDGDVDDKSGNGNDGTNNGATFTNFGKINQALSFDGVNDYVSITDDDIFDFGSGEFSVESWIKTTSVLRQWAVTRYKYYGPGWGLGTQSGYTLGYIRTAESGTNKREIGGIVSVSDNNWHHIVMVRTGDKIKLYTDGVFEIEGTLAGDVNDDEPIEVGRISFEGGSQYMSGLIDEVKIYNRALNATEISEHYNDVDSLGAVPVDKSYARIPDGSSNWVDPIPTPGAPNQLSEEEIGGLGWQEELAEEPILNEVFDEVEEESEIIVESEEINTDEEITTTTEESIIIEATTTDATTTEEEITTTTDEVITTEETTTTEEIIIDEATTTNTTTTDFGQESTTTEETITAEVTTETSGETTEDVIEEVVEEVTDEPTIDEIVEETVEEIIEEPIIEEPVIEETPIDEVPVIEPVESPLDVQTSEEQSVTVPDQSPSVQEGAGESPSDSDNTGDSVNEL